MDFFLPFGFYVVSTGAVAGAEHSDRPTIYENLICFSARFRQKKMEREEPNPFIASGRDLKVG